MGKRSDFERAPRDFYPTPIEAVKPLLPHLPHRTTFVEPCAGDGALIRHLIMRGLYCAGSYDIEPKRVGMEREDATTYRPQVSFDCFITNPPWDRSILHKLIVNLSDQAPTWLLFDADWVHTRQSAPFMGRLRAVVSVGRIKWIPDSKMTGKDNCAWHLFNKPNPNMTTKFFGRTA